jgi:DNA-binding response OmpR family regulator
LTTILVADDDLDIRELIVAKLSLAGDEVRAVADGTAALQALEDGGIDLALLDISMPGATGIEICEFLRASTTPQRVPVLLLSARAQDADLAAGYAAGADDYVVKPFSPRDLLARVQALLEPNRT